MISINRKGRSRKNIQEDPRLKRTPHSPRISAAGNGWSTEHKTLESVGYRTINVRCVKTFKLYCDGSIGF